MFDWDDKELTNMIWGDEGDTGDHIVPFKVKSQQLKRKDQSEESKIVKKTEQKITGNEIGVNDSKLGSSSSHQADEGIPQTDFCMSSWSLSDGREANPDSNVTELLKCLAEKARYSSDRGEKTSELEKGLDISHSTDESKEQGDFDEYGWANIGSFDDLDRMFSNDVPTFGDSSLSGADELWSSPKNVSNSPSKSLQSILDSQDLVLDIRTEFEQLEDHQFPLTGRGNSPSSQSLQKSEHYHKGLPTVKDQPYQHNKMMKFTKMSETLEAGAFQDLYGQRTRSRNSPGEFVNQLTPSHSSLMSTNMQNEFQGSGTSLYPHMPKQYMAASAFGKLTNPYCTVPVLSTVQCTDVKNQLMHPSYNYTAAISVNLPTDASARPSKMTPQEKLEKLRRRQQMQAMLAIQRQHQQFRHQVPIADQSSTQNCPQDNPLLLVDKTNFQGVPSMPSFDPTSLELYDSGNLTGGGDNSSEFSILHRLQDVVAKLDMGLRTCLRDSLFRLASCAAQRHHTSDIAHGNKTSQNEQEVIPKEESRYRYGGMPDTETVTNPTDRTVAHLLFHRPFEMTVAKLMEGPESLASSKMGTEEIGNFPKCSTPESGMNKQKSREEEGPAISLALRNAPNSGSCRTVGERVLEASQGNKRKF